MPSGNASLEFGVWGLEFGVGYPRIPCSPLQKLHPESARDGLKMRVTAERTRAENAPQASGWVGEVGMVPTAVPLRGPEGPSGDIRGSQGWPGYVIALRHPRHPGCGRKGATLLVRIRAPPFSDRKRINRRERAWIAGA
jgi:hypothetical protein